MHENIHLKILSNFYQNTQTMPKSTIGTILDEFVKDTFPKGTAYEQRRFFSWGIAHAFYSLIAQHAETVHEIYLQPVVGPIFDSGYLFFGHKSYKIEIVSNDSKKLVDAVIASYPESVGKELGFYTKAESELAMEFFQQFVNRTAGGVAFFERMKVVAEIDDKLDKMREQRHELKRKREELLDDD